VQMYAVNEGVEWMLLSNEVISASSIRAIGI
jgi:hypothetical protein